LRPVVSPARSEWGFSFTTPPKFAAGALTADLLIARPDFSRQYTKLVDVPFADKHLDRGYQIVGVSRTVPPSLGPQSFDF
jgi:hypothetical protein